MDKELMDRIQKLTGALYRVTDLYPDKEPLKWTLRNDAVYVYTNLMSVKDYGDILDAISRLIHTLELASSGGFISNLNFEILKKEYIKLQEFLEGRKQKALIGPELAQGPARHASQLAGVAGRHSKGQSNGHKGQSQGPARLASESVAGRQNKGQNNRKARIKAFLAKNNKKTIKEITSIFEGVSAKSIQRDLLDMVKSGELTAEGEKRWRIYGLAGD